MSQFRPSVDVIVATNRTSPYLAEALASVQAQTWPYWRLILVDDGAPDPAALDAAVQVLDKARVLHRRPAGVSAARNAGLAAGSGDLVAFLDDDDVWDPRRLEAQIDVLGVRPAAAGVFCGGVYIDSEGRSLESGWHAVPAAPEQMLDGSVPAPRIVTLLVTREMCLRVGGFDDSLWLAEDNDFVLRVLQEGPLLAVPEQLVAYRRHAGNTSDQALTESRSATDRLLAKQIAAAHARGDRATVALLRTHRRRHHRRASRESVRAMAAAGRRRDRGAFLEELGWAARHAPGFTAAAAVSGLCRTVRRTRPGGPKSGQDV